MRERGIVAESERGKRKAPSLFSLWNSLGIRCGGGGMANDPMTAPAGKMGMPPPPRAGRGGTCRVRVRRAAVARLSLLPRLIIPNLTSILRYALGAQQQMWPD